LTAKLTANTIRRRPDAGSLTSVTGAFPWLQALSAQVGEIAARNAAGLIWDRIRATKARQADSETIAELTEIINELIEDKGELVQIARSYEQELVSKQISPEDIEYISTNLVPIIKQVMASVAESRGESSAASDQLVSQMQPILSIETVTLLQMIGFNFRAAIGEPLTQLLARLISAQGPDPSVSTQELQRLQLVQQVALMEVAQDPEATERLARITGTAQ
jgi:hypothetical protein